MPGILQQRIQVAALGARREQALERIRREQQEQQEADADEAHHAEHARDASRRGRLRAEQRDRERPAGEHQHPQQQRAFVRAPGRGEAVVQRQLRVRVGRDVQHREIVADERRTRGSRTRTRRAGIARAPRAARAPSGAACAERRADERQRALRERDAAARGSARNGRVRESSGAPCVVVHQRLRRHALACAFLTASAASGGM